jgi:hypothetical protein
MTLHSNIIDVLGSNALPAQTIAERLMLPIQPVCKAIVELLALKKIRRAGTVLVETKTISRRLDTYAVAKPRKRDRHGERMAKARREFFGGEA